MHSHSNNRAALVLLLASLAVATAIAQAAHPLVGGQTGSPLDVSLDGTHNARDASSAIPPLLSDVQLCINTINTLWFTFDTEKAVNCSNPNAQNATFNRVFPDILTPGFVFSLVNLPIPPFYNTTISFNVTGIPALASTAAYGIDNCGEHHVAGPYSVKVESRTLSKTVYRLETRDIDYTRETDGSGYTVYNSKKESTCEVERTFIGHELVRRALLSLVVDNVITAYRIPLAQSIWNGPPVSSYPSAW